MGKRRGAARRGAAAANHPPTHPSTPIRHGHRATGSARCGARARGAASSPSPPPHPPRLRDKPRAKPPHRTARARRSGGAPPHPSRSFHRAAHARGPPPHRTAPPPPPYYDRFLSASSSSVPHLLLRSPSPPPPPPNPSRRRRRRRPAMSSSSSDQARDDIVSSPDLPPLAAPVAAAAAAAAAAASSSMGGGLGGGSGRRLPPPCWTHEETLALIEAYRDRWEALRKGNLRAADWDDVANAVTARCGRFPTATPKSGVQCRHKIEKLRKRYRAERSRSAGRSKGPKWPFYPLLHDLAGNGAPDPSPNAIVKIKTKGPAPPESPPSPVSSPSASEDEAVRSRSLHGLISNGGSGSGLRFTIPKASRTRPSAPAAARHKKRGNEDDAESEAMSEVAAALRAVGEGFMRMEERRLELSLQLEKERMESEMKRTQTMLDAQQIFLEAFLGKQPQQLLPHKRARLSPAMEED